MVAAPLRYALSDRTATANVPAAPAFHWPLRVDGREEVSEKASEEVSRAAQLQLDVRLVTDSWYGDARNVDGKMKIQNAIMVHNASMRQ